VPMAMVWISTRNDVHDQGPTNCNGIYPLSDFITYILFCFNAIRVPELVVLKILVRCSGVMEMEASPQLTTTTH
jgi:hypothetical protein